MEKMTSQSKVNLKEEEEIFEEKSVKATRALIQTFLQTVKAFRLYEANHPILLKFTERLKKDFDNYFEEFDSFPLLVGEYRLFYRGKVVYENQDVKESLAFFFYKDGIREIKFIRGLEFREVIDFLRIVRKGESVNRLEDDLVTLLWEKDFSHITFGTVDEFLESASHYIPATEEDFIERLEFKSFGKESLDDYVPEKERQETSSHVAESLKQALNPSPGQSLIQACQLTPDEIEEINQETEQEHQPDYIYLLTDNLVEILLHLGEDMDAYENMISYFERTTGAVLEKREIKKAATVLKKLNDAMESMALKDKQIFAIRRILDNFSSPNSIEFLGEAMKGNGEVDSEAILQCLRLLTPKGIEPLCHLLGKVDSGKWRKAICDVLATLSQGDIKPLVKFLSDPNPFLVFHVLYVLGKIGHPTTLKYLGNLVAHPDPKVREETLQLLKKLGEQSKNLIEKFLTDPLREIRAKASLIFANVAKEKAAKPLIKIILSDDFFKRDYDEKTAFFKALGETESEEVVPVLQKIAEKRKWFQKGKWDEMRLCANNTLKMMGVGKGTDPDQLNRKQKQIARSIR
jgi:HEAT repeat protein